MDMQNLPAHEVSWRDGPALQVMQEYAGCAAFGCRLRGFGEMETRPEYLFRHDLLTDDQVLGGDIHIDAFRMRTMSAKDVAQEVIGKIREQHEAWRMAGTASAAPSADMMEYTPSRNGPFRFTFRDGAEEQRLLRVAFADDPDPMRVLIEWNEDGSVSLLEQITMSELRDLVVMLATRANTTVNKGG